MPTTKSPFPSEHTFGCECHYQKSFLPSLRAHTHELHLETTTFGDNNLIDSMHKVGVFNIQVPTSRRTAGAEVWDSRQTISLCLALWSRLETTSSLPHIAYGFIKRFGIRGEAGVK